jgi:hypothetical protein
LRYHSEMRRRIVPNATTQAKDRLRPEPGVNAGLTASIALPVVDGPSA